jgi:hypothetical protein
LRLLPTFLKAFFTAQETEELPITRVDGLRGFNGDGRNESVECRAICPA